MWHLVPSHFPLLLMSRLTQLSWESVNKRLATSSGQWLLQGRTWQGRCDHVTCNLKIMVFAEKQVGSIEVLCVEFCGCTCQSRIWIEPYKFLKCPVMTTVEWWSHLGLSIVWPYTSNSWLNQKSEGSVYKNGISHGTLRLWGPSRVSAKEIPLCFPCLEQV